MRQVTRKGLITVAAAGGVLALSGGYAHADSGAQGDATRSPGVLAGNSVQVPVHIPVNVCGNTVNVVGLLNPAIGNSCVNASSTGGPHEGPHDGPGDGGHGGGGAHGGGAHHGGQHSGGSHDSGTPHAPQHGGGSHAGGGADHSPGVGSGNTIEVPIDVPVNVCGLGVNVVGLGNPVTGEGCENDAPAVTPPTEEPQHPGPAKPVQPGTPAVPGTPSTPATPGKPAAPGGHGTPSAPNTPGAQTVVEPVGRGELAQTGAGSLGTVIPVGAGLLLAGSVIYRRTRATA
ncbi:chaplin family protein [Streptomyces sp. NPDC088725]|uniref:chaplin n=1 Tax=Streptomyces sp. NPDC088725 TaxID=3365873 RepID=UPI003829A440